VLSSCLNLCRNGQQQTAYSWFNTVLSNSTEMQGTDTTVMKGITVQSALHATITYAGHHYGKAKGDKLQWSIGAVRRVLISIS